MIDIDRTSNRPVYDQLVEQLRYLIAAGKYQVGDLLPSTRALGRQLDLSFHTVRKAYRALEEEGLVSAHVGSGYRVEERSTLDKADRMERGASVVQDAMQRLIGLGLTEQEIDYVLQEQMTFFDAVPQSRKIMVVAPYRELGEALSAELSEVLQEDVIAVLPSELGRHRDAEVVISTLPLYGQVKTEFEQAEVLGCGVYLSIGALEAVAGLLPHESLGLVVRHADTIEPLSHTLRMATGFDGQVTATLADASVSQVAQVLRHTDLVLYTPSTRRRLLGQLDELRSMMVRFNVDPESVRTIREAVANRSN